MRTLILGEALVDLVCEQPVAGLAQAPAFVPHPGGAGAALAVAAVAAGGDVVLAGATADDPWGGWLRERLERAGVAVDPSALLPGARTPVAWVTADERGEPTRLPPEAPGVPGLEALGERLPAAVEAAGALCLTSSTLIAVAAREATQAAQAQALELGRPVVFVCALEPARWKHPGRAVTVSRDAVPGSCVLLDRAQARALSGEPDPVRAADALLAAGAVAVAVDGGPEGAWVRGAGMRRHVPGVPSRPVDRSGAHAAWAGVLLARLADAGGYPPALAAALPAAVTAGARAAERWGAC